MWSPSSSKRILVVGLGNPGRGYARHRHNLGFMVVDELARRENGLWTTNREKTMVCEVTVEGARLVLAKPQTYMNLSGKAVSPIVKRIGADPAAMIVIHDDLDLARGRVRIKVGGGDGGHKGVRSIADSLRFKDFARLRLGIGRPPTGVQPEEFVLSGFPPDEQSAVDDLVHLGVLAVRIVASVGVDQAQNVIHSGRLTPDSVWATT